MLADEPPFFWWESLFLFERLVVVGFLQWIPSDFGLIRIQCGLLTTLAYMTILSYLKPFKRDDLDVLSLGAQLAILGFFFGALNIRLHTDLVTVRPEDDALAQLITGFSDDFMLSLVIFALNVAVFLIFCAMTAYQVVTTAQTTTLLLVGSNRPPELRLTSGRRYHLFLSHVWASGQDQTAVIKRQLQLLLPGIHAFLDVDDLEEIGRLEESVEESEVVLSKPLALDLCASGSFHHGPCIFSVPPQTEGRPIDRLACSQPSYPRPTSSRPIACARWTRPYSRRSRSSRCTRATWRAAA